MFFVLKLLLIFGIFAFLFWKASQTADGQENAFQKLVSQQKQVELLVAAFFVQFFAVSMTICRWRWLARSLGLVLSIKEAFRLGFLGLMLNLAPMGIVGGDAVKAYVLAKQNPEARPQAVASVIVDRIIGLLVMFLLGSFFVLWTGFYSLDAIWARSISQIVFALTIIGYSCVGIVFLPFFAKGHVEQLIARIPVCGRVASKLTKSLLLYRERKICLLQSFLITFLVHLPFGVSLYLIANGLFTSVPTFVDHLMLYNIVNLTSMIPLAAGPFEFVLDEIYPLFPVDGEAIHHGVGLIVALGYRIISICVAALGIVYYLTSKYELPSENEIDEVMN